MGLPSWEQVWDEAMQGAIRSRILHWVDLEGSAMGEVHDRGKAEPGRPQHAGHGDCDHAAPGTVYWSSNRRVTRAGIRRFLSLTFDAARMPGVPEWRHRYERAIWVHNVGTRLGLRLNAPTQDKSLVRFLLRDPNDRRSPEAIRAWRWASQGGVL